MLSISGFVHMFVCLCVCLSVCYQGKVMERSGLTILTFFTKGCKIAVQRKVFFYEFFKDQEVTQLGSGGYTTRIRRLYNKDPVVIQQGSGAYTTRIRR